VLLENLRRVAESIAENKVAREVAHAAWDAADSLSSHELDVLFARTGSVAAASAAAGGPGTTPAENVGPGKIIRSDDRTDNEKKDQCVHQQRRNDPFPPFFFLSPLLERHIPRDYFTSFGVAAITLTPAPRAMSIAAITSEYLTAGSPLTKMILSGRGS